MIRICFVRGAGMEKILGKERVEERRGIHGKGVQQVGAVSKT